MNNSVGFIGTGNMGGALAKAAARAVAKDMLFVADKFAPKAEELAMALGCKAVTAEEIAQNCGFIILGVKPQMLGALLEELKQVLTARSDDFVLVSMAAGVAMADIQRMAGAEYPVIRIMPNTPVAVGQGMVLYDHTENTAEEAVAAFCDFMRFAGRLDPLPEKFIDAGSAVSGCGPAFACLFMEALADGGVACGLPRAKAMVYAAQMLLGTAALALESGQHPGQMKDAVCSPGGSTIAGVRALEQGGFRAAAMNAVEEAYYRTVELGK